ncbi:hypothetical protein DERF_006774 [Dermatophagoides farinae]|uniref:Uncharacterized protein n=1 Tax=Dermatophagoides farinae TaxID=6954 RepID=A0A922HWK9_DERFA|nr:hypothetical protein DERF_006774 [Dermatophagoides farinae]
MDKCCCCHRMEKTIATKLILLPLFTVHIVMTVGRRYFIRMFTISMNGYFGETEILSLEKKKN